MDGILKIFAAVCRTTINWLSRDLRWGIRIGWWEDWRSWWDQGQRALIRYMIGLKVSFWVQNIKAKEAGKSQSFFFFFLRAVPMACGSSWARGWIGTAAEAHTTATATWDQSPIYDLHCSLWQLWIHNPLYEARDWTCILPDPMSGSQPAEPQWEGCREIWSNIRGGETLLGGITGYFILFFLRLHLQHREVLGLEVKLELQPQASTTATATLDMSHICNPHHCLQKHCIFNPLSKTKIEPTSSWWLFQVLNPLSHNGNS